MALFGNNKPSSAPASAKATAGKKASKDNAPAMPKSARDLSHVLRHARITEKASMHMAQSVYVFDIATSATKKDVAAAVQKFYAVTPRRVNVVSIPTKTKRNARTGKTGISTGGKKAYVYLKNGETINL